MSQIKISHKKLIASGKKDQQKYLILLSDQTVFIDTEYEGMKRARKHGKTIIEMMPTNARLIAQQTSLTKLLERLEVEKFQL